MSTSSPPAARRRFPTFRSVKNDCKQKKRTANIHENLMYKYTYTMMTCQVDFRETRLLYILYSV